MKKILPIFLSIPVLVFSSCHAGEIDKSKIALDYGHYRENQVTSVYQFDNLNYDQLDALMAKKESFVLLTYHNQYCGCWLEFSPLAVAFANQYHYDFRILDVAELSGHSEKFGIYSGEDLMPGIVFIRRGKVIRQSIYGKIDENKRQFFKQYPEFESYMFKGVYLPKMFYIDKTVLDTKLENNEELNLYIAKASCDDCNYINKEFLYKWSDKNHTINDPLYIFDIEPYQSDEYPEGYYQSIKDAYGLSEEINETLGYNTGYVPTFQRRTGWTINDMITVLNDSVELIDDNYVIHSFFNDSRVGNSPILRENPDKFVLEGKIASEDMLETIVISPTISFTILSRKAQYKLHEDATKLFFATYVK